MQPNRIAIYSGVLAAFGAFLTALLGAFATDTAKAAVAVAAIIVVGAIVCVYLLGWQKYEERVDLEELADQEAGDPDGDGAGVTPDDPEADQGSDTERSRPTSSSSPGSMPPRPVRDLPQA